jgi:hypothetical protein
MKKRLIAALSVVVLAGLPARASADVAANIRADLLHSASAVPGAQVSVAPASGDALEIGSGQEVNVTMTLAQGTALAGILTPPSTPALYSTTAASVPVWDIAVMEAIKHALAGGAQLESAAITSNYVGLPVPSGPELLVALLPYAPWTKPPSTMSQDQVRQAIQQALPAWAQQSTVAVADDAAGERVVTTSLSLPASSFSLFNPQQLLWALTNQQRILRDQGANIGRVVSRITSPENGDPVYTGVADGELGFSASWRSPLIRGLINESPGPTTATGAGYDTARGVADQTGLSDASGLFP